MFRSVVRDGLFQLGLTGQLLCAFVGFLGLTLNNTEPQSHSPTVSSPTPAQAHAHYKDQLEPLGARLLSPQGRGARLASVPVRTGHSGIPKNSGQVVRVLYISGI